MSAADQAAFPFPVAGLATVPLAAANDLLTRWGHYLGPVNRPFGSQCWVFDVDGMPASVAVSASIVSPFIRTIERIPLWELADGKPGRHAGDLARIVRIPRGDIVELARLCSAPGQRWATRPMLRLWREVAAPRWPYWPVTHAIAYSQNSRHDGSIYRFDGWTRVKADAARSGGAGTRSWSQPVRVGDPSFGRKTLWLWRYEKSA